MSEILAGWVRWEDNKPTEHQMGRIGTATPRRDETTWAASTAPPGRRTLTGRLATPGSSRTMSP